MNAVLVEFVGSLLFMYVIILTGNAFAIGAALAFCIFLGGKISGGHFNPAVTVMMVMAKKTDANLLLPYVLAQVAGGLLALEIHKRVKF
jgi:glycerol uptake facilitator-like aquaporin